MTKPDPFATVGDYNLDPAELARWLADTRAMWAACHDCNAVMHLRHAPDQPLGFAKVTIHDDTCPTMNGPRVA